jgi:hypothetical protein
MAFKVFRFTFSEETTTELYDFNRIHQYNDKHAYKEAWEKWQEQHQELINNETERLTQIGFEGDVVGKMYHSSRYYIRNQFIKEKSDKKTTRKTRTIIPKQILREMDEHIKAHSTEKPIEAYRLYQRTNGDLVESKQDVHKAYMNRYYVIKQKNKTLE